MFLDCAPAYFEYLSKAFFHGLPTVLYKIVGVSLYSNVLMESLTGFVNCFLASSPYLSFRLSFNHSCLRLRHRSIIKMGESSLHRMSESALLILTELRKSYFCFTFSSNEGSGRQRKSQFADRCPRRHSRRVQESCREWRREQMEREWFENRVGRFGRCGSGGFVICRSIGSLRLEEYKGRGQGTWLFSIAVAGA